jgi:hypothetical protein
MDPMNRATTARDGWHPQSAQDRTAILRELQEIIASPQFCNSKRYPALLQYIVECTLAGESDLLKERTLGIEVFDRPPDYDTNADTVVRFTAGEVRKRLLLYYSEHGRSSGIRISLPAGSYIPEFLIDQDELGSAHDKPRVELTLPSALTDQPQLVSAAISSDPLYETAKRSAVRRVLFAIAGMILIAITSGLIWKYGMAHSPQAVDDFWGPVVHDQHSVIVCPGGVVFAEKNYSGVVTAGKDIQYPFVSVQTASAISQVSSMVERLGATAQLQAAPSTALPQLREHSIVLLGGYNNQWTMRLLEPLRFHFTPEPVESIVDQTQPQAHWSRDRSIPYSSTDDYALVARYRDTTTDSWVVVLAGLGRNGTEAAAQFVTSPHYMQLLREQLGTDFSNRNIEFLLRVHVIDGNTGAPSVQAVHAW